MKLADVVRQNPRLARNVGEVLDVFGPYLTARPNARIHWVEEYVRGVVDGSAHRTGLVAVTADSIVLGWRHGLLYRKQGLRELRRDEVTSWSLAEDGLTASATSGEVRISFLPGSAEAAAFAERFALIDPFRGKPQAPSAM